MSGGGCESSSGCGICGFLDFLGYGLRPLSFFFNSLGLGFACLVVGASLVVGVGFVDFWILGVTGSPGSPWAAGAGGGLGTRGAGAYGKRKGS